MNGTIARPSAAVRIMSAPMTPGTMAPGLKISKASAATPRPKSAARMFGLIRICRRRRYQGISSNSAATPLVCTTVPLISIPSSFCRSSVRVAAVPSAIPISTASVDVKLLPFVTIAR